METSRLVVVNEWNGKYTVNESYRPAAERLCKKFSELKYVPVPAILFVDNNDGSGKDRNKTKLAQISKISDKWQDLIKQFTDRAFMFMIEFFKKNLEDLSHAQIMIELYRQLRYIDRDGDLRHPDVMEFNEVLYNLDPQWNEKHRFIANILEDGVTFQNIRQPRLFDEGPIPGAPLRLVKT